MRQEIPIINITLTSTAIRKGLSNWGRKTFLMDVTYHLQDGRTLPGTVGSERKKDVPAALARDLRAASAGSMTACFDEQGDYCGTSTRWTLGAAGLIPKPAELPTPCT